MIALHVGLEGCSQPRELWFVDILMYIPRARADHGILTVDQEI